jgi:hypothetical protein
MGKFSICIKMALASALTVSAAAFADGTADVIGQAAESARQNSQAAQANRNLADQLYKQALADHDAAWSKFPPNVSLLSKALQESKDAKAADDQAKEFARGAMHSIHTGGNSGDFNLKKYGVLSESQLNDLANKSSPYMPAAEKTLGKYGMKLTEDKMSIKTPLGTLPLDMSMSTLEKGLRGVAAGLGYNPDDVSKGLAAGVKTRDGLAAQAMAALKASGAGASASGETGPGAAPGAPAAVAGEGEAKAEGAAGAVAAASAGDGGDVQTTVSSIDKRQEELQRNRAAFLKSMGIGTGEPLGASHQDIFKMVHLRYQAKRTEGEFIESETLPITVASVKPLIKPAVKAPARLPASNGPIQPFVEKVPVKPLNKVSRR